MNGNLYFLAIAIPLLIFFVVRSRKRKLLINAKKEQLKSIYKRETVFLCDAADDIDKNVIQLYGEAFNTPVRPGMKININGAEYAIKEVYANDNTPDKPDPQVSAGVPDTPIVIETSNWDWILFRQILKRELVIPLKLR